MSTQIKAGKRPLSQKPRPAKISHEDIFGNTLGIDPETIRIIESKGHVVRFINVKQFQYNGGRHATGWKPIRTSTLKEWGCDIMDTQAFLTGSSADDYLYRGTDLVLATRPKEINERHKAYLKQEASDRGFSNKREAQALREFSRANGVQATVTEGFEDEGEQSNDDE